MPGQISHPRRPVPLQIDVRNEHAQPSQRELTGSDQPAFHDQPVRQPPPYGSHLDTPASSIFSPPLYWRYFSPKEPMSLTFGIELEYVFAFDRSPRVGFEWIGVDGITDEELFEEEEEDDLALSYDDESEPATGVNMDVDVHQPVVFSDPHSCARIGQASTTMFVTQSVLEQAGLECTAGERGYESWNIQADGSIDEPKNLSKYLPDRLDSDDECDWVMSGQELVSRVLAAPEDLSLNNFTSSNALQEIACFLKALRGRPRDPFGVFVNESCGFHVHVARESQDMDEMIPLPVLQHLAYLLVQFEELINVLHHESRRCRSDFDSHYVETNLMGIRRSTHWCRRVESTDLSKAQKKIFHKDMTPAGLAKLMDACLRPNMDESGHVVLETRYKFVNFEPLMYEGGAARTIEFRQHIGTLDFDEIAHWIHFILSLVRTAERMATWNDRVGVGSPCSTMSSSSPLLVSFRKRQANKYQLRCAKLQDEFERMYDLLQFDDNVRDYWRRRFVRLNPAEWFRVEVDADGIEHIMDGEDRCPSCNDW
ncbi:hypothetical protein PV08_10304 [Exophiala spinifera]|uniref:Amidoligase enzyme n=1 Tax=Exophiala spinifera TaxID=91928 RepID=A0A0D2AXA0_9EURO|nr:uncharacterized protein PV08_10304 [Exophiala spinifera]KIW11005.1 hypothetical protein PV08_10304 [Exophiala spinifera]